MGLRVGVSLSPSPLAYSELSNALERAAWSFWAADFQQSAEARGWPCLAPPCRSDRAWLKQWANPRFAVISRVRANHINALYVPCNCVCGLKPPFQFGHVLFECADNQQFFAPLRAWAKDLKELVTMLDRPEVINLLLDGIRASTQGWRY